MVRSNPKVKWGVTTFYNFAKSAGCDDTNYAAIDKELRAKGLQYAQEDKASSTRVAASTIEQWCISLWDQYGSAFKRQKDDTREKAIEYFLQGVRRFKSNQKNAPRQCQTPAPTDSASQVATDNSALRRIRYKAGDPQPVFGDYSVHIYNGDQQKKFSVANVFHSSATAAKPQFLDWDLFVAAVKKKFPEFDAAAYSLFPVPYEGGEGSENMAVDDIDALQAESQDQYNARLASLAFRMVSRNDDTISDSPSKPTDSLEPANPLEPVDSPKPVSSPKPARTTGKRKSSLSSHPKSPPGKRAKPTPSHSHLDNADPPLRSNQVDTTMQPPRPAAGVDDQTVHGARDANDGQKDEIFDEPSKPVSRFVDINFVAPEKEDGPTEEDRLGDEDYNTQIERLQEKLQDMQAVAQIDRALLLEFCVFFHLDPGAIDPTGDILITGMKMPVHIYQAYAAWWVVRHEKQYRVGGFVGDEMGLGKTVTSLLVTVLNRMLYLMHREVKQSRDNEDGKHLPADAEAGAKCPSHKNFCIQCVCEPGSVSLLLNVTSGTNLFVVPPLVVGTYAAEMEKWLDTEDKDYGWRWFICHDSYKDWAIPEPHYPSVPIGFIGRLQEGQKVAPHPTEIPSRPSVPSYIAELQRDLTMQQAQPDQNRFLIVTTWGSCERWVEEKLRNVVRPAYSFTYTPSRFKSERRCPENRPEYSEPGHSFGRIWVDEFHTAYNINTHFTKIIKRLLKQSPWDIPVWAMSGTPYEVSPLEMAGYIWAMEKDWWEECPTLRRFTHATISTYKPDFNRIMKLMKDNVPLTSNDKARWKEIVDYFSEFCSRFMIRRETDTKWLGKPMVKLPLLRIKPVTCDFDHRYDSMLENLKDDFNNSVDGARTFFEREHEKWVRRGKRGPEPMLTTDTKFRTTRRLLLLAVSYPYTAKMVTDSYVRHTAAELCDDNYWKDYTNNNPYVKHLDEIVESSCKLEKLDEIMDELDDEEDPFDSSGERKIKERLVIITSYPVVSLIVALWLEFKRGYERSQIGLIHGQLSTKVRNRLVDGFQDTLDVNTGKRKNQNHVRVLVGTAGTMGYSITCTKAKKLVLMEPFHLARDELQSLKRIHRVSQKHECLVYKLSTAKYGLETNIIKAQDVKNAVQRGFYVTKLVDRSTEDEKKELLDAAKEITLGGNK